MTAWRSTGHRGDTLEDLIDLTNDYYHKQGLCRIDKAATPIKVVEINDQGLITKGYFEKKATVDFFGAVQGIPVAFDAKETDQKSLPLYNIHAHQVAYMEAFTAQKGLAFLILHFKFCDAYFLVPFELLLKYWRGAEKGGRKSIPFTAMEDRFRIPQARNGILNYLPVLNAYLDYKAERQAAPPKNAEAPH